MKVCGFSFIRNALMYDYPIVEAVKSILPICDQFIIAIGKSDDNTKDLILSINDPKIKIIDTVWDDSLRTGGVVLAKETDKAFHQISEEFDWAFYIQGDEVMHEDDLPIIKKSMQIHLNDKNIDGLLLNYRHFYGTYDYIGTSSKWYRNEIRVIRNDKKIYSYKDAQGFRKSKNEKLKVAKTDAFIHHYGWVKDPTIMKKKEKEFHKLWHSDDWIKQNVKDEELFDFLSRADKLEKYIGSHPAVMKNRIDRLNWQLDFDLSFNRMTTKDRLKQLIRRIFGVDLNYKNYLVVK